MMLSLIITERTQFQHLSSTIYHTIENCVTNPLWPVQLFPEWECQDPNTIFAVIPTLFFFFAWFMLVSSGCCTKSMPEVHTSTTYFPRPNGSFYFSLSGTLALQGTPHLTDCSSTLLTLLMKLRNFSHESCMKL